MKKVALISYPSDKNDLLSLCEYASRYELYFWGRFRLLDFILSFALSIDSSEVFLFEPDHVEELEEFSREQTTLQTKFPPLVVKKVKPSYKFSLLLNTLVDCEADYFLIINGDNPFLIDIKEEVRKTLTEETDHHIIPVSFQEYTAYSTQVLMIQKDLLISLLQRNFTEITSFSVFFAAIIAMLRKRNQTNETSVDGYFHPISNAVDYFHSNMDVLKYHKPMMRLIDSIPIGSIIEPENKGGLIGKKAEVYDSIIADGCQIEGHVENSIIFPNVIMHKKTKVINSVILPNTIIGKGSTITNAIIDENSYADTQKSAITSLSSKANIGENSEIGASNSEAKNQDYPNAIFQGITLVGKDCSLPKNIKVGSGCYISSESNDTKLKKNQIIKDNEAI